MRVNFLPLPGMGATVSRPVVDVRMEGIPEIGISCLVDTGALHNRFDARLAELAGLDLDKMEGVERFSIGGETFEGKVSQLELSIGTFTWLAPICFVKDWTWDFQILGQKGFLRWFAVCFHVADDFLLLDMVDH